jgi:hypothetical protein
MTSIAECKNATRTADAEIAGSLQFDGRRVPTVSGFRLCANADTTQPLG